MDRSQWARGIESDLRSAATLRARSKARSNALRIRQRDEMRSALRTGHAWLAGDPRLALALAFLMDDAYPVDSPSWRESQALSALASMARLLPMPALEALACAARLDAVAESIDFEIQTILMSMGYSKEGAAEHLEPTERAGQPVDSWGRDCERARMAVWSVQGQAQTEALGSVAQALCAAARMPLAAQALKAMALPARLAGLSDLQGFLERGLGAFARIPNPALFCKKLVDTHALLIRGDVEGPADQAGAMDS